MELRCVSSRVSVPTGCLQVWRFHSADMEPEREQHERLHAAGAAALHPGRGAGRAQQQGRDIARLECKCSWQSPQCPQENPPDSTSWSHFKGQQRCLLWQRLKHLCFERCCNSFCYTSGTSF